MAVIELTKANFKDTIEKNSFVIVDFWAPWCEPCVNFTPLLLQQQKPIPTWCSAWSTPRSTARSPSISM